MGDQPEPVEPAETPAPDTEPQPIPAPVTALETVEHPDVYTALAAAQAQFPRIPKNQTATVHGKDGKAGYSYTYADLGDVLAACRPILARHGLALVQRTKYRETDGKLMLLTEVHHGATGGQVDSELELAQNPGQHQAFGGALTYLRRYESVTLLGVAAEEDLDGSNVEPVAPRNGNGHAPAPELPAWAKPVGGDKRRELIDVLERCIGRPRATAFVDNAAGAYNGLPLAVAVAVRSFARAVIEELDPLAFDEAEEKRTAKRTAAAQDAAAEAPDAPAADEPTDEEREALDAARAAEEAGVDVSDLDLPAPEPEREEASASAEDPPTQRTAPAPAELAPASIPMPEGALDKKATPVGRIKALRDAGCICVQPIGNAEAGPDLDSACPIMGHGITF